MTGDRRDGDSSTADSLDTSRRRDTSPASTTTRSPMVNWCRPPFLAAVSRSRRAMDPLVRRKHSACACPGPRRRPRRLANNTVTTARCGPDGEHRLGWRTLWTVPIHPHHEHDGFFICGRGLTAQRIAASQQLARLKAPAWSLRRRSRVWRPLLHKAAGNQVVVMNRSRMGRERRRTKVSAAKRSTVPAHGRAQRVRGAACGRGGTFFCAARPPARQTGGWG